MTRGELIRERSLVKAEQCKKQMVKGFEDFMENKLDYIGTGSVMLAITLFIGAVGTADISETIPESTLLIGTLSLLWIVIYFIHKYMKED